MFAVSNVVGKVITLPEIFNESLLYCLTKVPSDLCREIFPLVSDALISLSKVNVRLRLVFTPKELSDGLVEVKFGPFGHPLKPQHGCLLLDNIGANKIGVWA